MYKAVIESMLKEISSSLDAGAILASITLTYVCIDAMTYLGLPLGEKEQTKIDFINWVNKYLKTESNQSYQYEGNDVYSARCAQLHTYSNFSNFGKKNNCKQFGYHDGSEHLFNPNESRSLVLISIKRFIHDFCIAVESFFYDALNNSELKKRIDSRISELNQQFLISA